MIEHKSSTIRTVDADLNVKHEISPFKDKIIAQHQDEVHQRLISPHPALLTLPQKVGEVGAWKAKPLPQMSVKEVDEHVRGKSVLSVTYSAKRKELFVSLSDKWVVGYQMVVDGRGWYLCDRFEAHDIMRHLFYSDIADRLICWTKKVISSWRQSDIGP